MNQIIDLGSNLVDHFAVFEIDGYTKKTGETVFTTTVWKGGVVTAITSSIAEIGSTGEYALTLTPTSAGKWSAEVIVDYNKAVYGVEFEVKKADVEICFAAADDDTTTRFSVWMERDGERLTDFDSVAATLKASDGSTVVSLTTDTADTADGLFAFSAASSAITAGYEYYLDVTATRGSISWSNNLGFAKVV